MTARLTTVNVGSPDPRRLVEFYGALLGWTEVVDRGDWAVVRDPEGGVAVSSQLEEGYVPPVWPPVEGAQQMTSHLEVLVDDLEGEVARAVALGATQATVQPQDDVRVMLDPDGHPFCLWTEG